MVLVSVVSMLLGTVLYIASGDPGKALLAEGEEVPLFDVTAPSWDSNGRFLEATLFGPANYTFELNGEVPPELVDGLAASNGTYGVIPAGKAHTWDHTVGPGESVRVTVTSTSEDPLIISTKVTTPTYVTVGLVLVAFGLLGFVFYRFGMTRSTA